MTAEKTGANILEEKQKEPVKMEKETQPHPDEIPGLPKLQQAGF